MNYDKYLKQYQKQILLARDKKATTIKIINEINQIKSPLNNQPISNTEKKKILIGLRKELLGRTVGLTHAQDNTEYLELIEIAINMLGDK